MNIDSSFWYQVIHVMVPIILACIINIVIYTQGWNKNNSQSPVRGLPPGYVIAIVWIVILGLLGYAHYLVYPSIASWVIVIAILYCLAYPFLTSGLKNTYSNIYNILSFIIAVLVFAFVYHNNHYAALFTIPFLLWTLYVSIITNIMI